MEKKKVFNIANFIENPSVAGGVDIFGHLNSKYIPKYNSYIARHKLIPFKMYRDHKEHEEYLFHFQAESDKNPEVIYDIVIRFYTTEATVKQEPTLKNYKLQFFSNSPGFVFTYAYVYNKYGLLINDLIDKLDQTALANTPSKTNPRLGVGYDYSIFYCLRYLILNSFYLVKKEIDRKGLPLTQFDPNNIATSNAVLERRNPKDLVNFNKLKKTFLHVTEKPKEVINKIGSKFGLVKPMKAKGATGAKGPIKPRKAK